MISVSFKVASSYPLEKICIWNYLLMAYQKDNVDELGIF